MDWNPINHSKLHIKMQKIKDDILKEDYDIF